MIDRNEDRSVDMLPVSFRSNRRPTLEHIRSGHEEKEKITLTCSLKNIKYEYFRFPKGACTECRIVKPCSLEKWEEQFPSCDQRTVFAESYEDEALKNSTKYQIDASAEDGEAEHPKQKTE